MIVHVVESEVDEEQVKLALEAEDQIIQPPRKKLCIKDISDSKFRLNCKSLALTYPQCTLSREEVRDQLVELMVSKNPEEYIIAREVHKDGEFHIHVYWKNSTKVNIKNPTALDLKDSTGKVFHGNYQSTKSKVHWVKYVTKEDDHHLAFGIDAAEFLSN